MAGRIPNLFESHCLYLESKRQEESSNDILNAFGLFLLTNVFLPIASFYPRTWMCWDSPIQVFQNRAPMCWTLPDPCQADYPLLAYTELFPMWGLGNITVQSHNTSQWRFLVQACPVVKPMLLLSNSSVKTSREPWKSRKETAPCDMASWMKPVLDVLTELLLGKILAKLRPPNMSDGQDTLSSQEKKKGS